MPFKIKEIIKEKYWIVEGQYGKVGTLRKIDEGHYEFFDQNSNTTELLDSLKSFKSVNTAEISGDLQVYKGLPTNTSILYPVEDDELPLFKKAENGKTIFVAGYYILKYEGMGWQHAFCPKLETINKYEHRGPYFTEWDMNINLKKAKQE
jgi:hypothetical protein|tara:strand:- start:6955 stop:7404 length:450 start_codon:yes stop_codon:yes gene_type:complete